MLKLVTTKHYQMQLRKQQTQENKHKSIEEKTLMTPRGKGPRNQQTNQTQALILLSCYCYLINVCFCYSNVY